MIELPPFEDPSCQTNPILSSSVIERTFAKLIGASGTNCIIAPPPTSESGDSPYTLYALTLTLIAEPSTDKLNGAEVKVSMGIVHSVTLIMVESDPSQSTSSVAYVLSDYLNQTLYPVMGVPLSDGLSQLMTT
jgi:hypothetical protein